MGEGTLRHARTGRRVSREPSLRVRLARAPWQPLALLVAIAAGFNLWAELYPEVARVPGGLVGHERREVGHAHHPVVHDLGPLPLCSRTGGGDCVIDGDTIRLHGLRIRIADIDTPETGGARCSFEAALGHRATLRMQELLNAGPFELVPLEDRDEDIYGRKLRIVRRDGRSLGAILVAEGLARPWDGARRSWCG
jgi:micrococcal nuclease